MVTQLTGYTRRAVRFRQPGLQDIPLFMPLVVDSASSPFDVILARVTLGGKDGQL